jgi:glycosyltransferase involved in cell wall biosynthesis
MIVSAGRLRRDYSILIEAVQDLDLTVVLAPYSPWVPEDAPFVLRKLPRNVHVVRCSYYELRDLYARALAVAVPLAQSGTQSGSLVTYEAMATGKAVLVTRTQGQAGLGVVQEGDTGYYIPPGDVQGWRMAIQEMCAHPEKAAHMGRKAREVVETGLNLDCYVQDMTTIVRSALAKKELVKAHPTPGPERR